MNFGELLAKYRKRSDLTKTDLAKKIDVTPGYIMNLEATRKKPPTYELCDKMATILRLTRVERVDFFGHAFFERAKPEDRKFIRELKFNVPREE